jgi:hypothetical protein
MNGITSVIQGNIAKLSVHGCAVLAAVAALSVRALAGMNPAFDRNHFGTGANRDRMNTAWLGNSADTGCFKTMYVTKQITTCGLCGALT